ncbi:hypothetical protein CARUB_v10012721mg [Capsella rubella]|uniref:Transcription repressor n=1 Tax=Capsella rubella TaxID=81985 RepID=R0GM10_9BRAS|nr:transcription repressor OFP1 [Capsella rubella]EOA12233.1 hypothetical protein CARUB_v10012721mg [Capsella rubella]
MGNYRFKLSELIPNAWFYKLRDMGKSKKHHRPPNKHLSPPTPRFRPSPSTPRSAGHPLLHRPTVDSKSSTTSADSSATGTGSFSPEFRTDQALLPNSPCSCSKLSTDLRPIITKPATPARKPAVSSPAGVRRRLRSPRISTRKSVSVRRSGGGTSARRSRAVVKASVDPRRDFKESMEEMIAENKIRESKDLEELLACYLCLNSDEYHSVIINVFKQIWLDLNLPPNFS